METEEARAYIESVLPVLNPKMQEAIKVLTQKPKTGHWIPVRFMYVSPAGYKLYYCSECHREVGSKYGTSLSKEYPYCHCGAKMEEAVEK